MRDKMNEKMHYVKVTEKGKTKKKFRITRPIVKRKENEVKMDGDWR